MSIITSKLEDGVLTLFASGRIDSANAQQAEAEIGSALSENPHTCVVLDAEALSYISSAGLRVVLRLRKNEPTLILENVSADVYEILDMTGFTEMMTVNKAYRRISVDGCEVIGQGANGKVYRIDPDTIVKVYLNPDSLPDIHRERELARRAFVLGIPTAIPYDVVKVGEGYGSVFELLNAKSFAKLISLEPEHVDDYVELSVNLLKKIHSTEVRSTDMPDMREVAIGWAEFVRDYLPADKGEKLVALVRAVPVRYRMLHGDYHQKNVMNQNGETLLIDMDTLCYGHPIFELGSMFNAYKGFSAVDPTTVERFLGIPAEMAAHIWEKSLALYLNTDDPERIAEVERKAMLIGYTRLLRRLIRRHGLETEQGRKEIEFYRSSIIALLDQVDTLEF